VSRDEESAVDNFARVTEITRNIYRQASVKSVLSATSTPAAASPGCARWANRLRRRWSFALPGSSSRM
jgi:hypothetical protein